MKSFFTLILTILFSLSLAHGQKAPNSYPAEDFTTPKKTMLYFLKTMKGYKGGDKEALNLATKALNQSQLDPETKLDTSRLAARRLIKTIDKIKFVEINKIPENPKNGKWVFSEKEIIVSDRAILAEIAIGKTKDGDWLFTPETLVNINEYLRSVSHKKNVEGVIELRDFKTRFKESMPEFTGRKSFYLLNGQWIALFLIILFGLIFEKIARYFIGNFALKIFFRGNVELTEERKKKLTFPMGIIVFSLNWIIFIRFLEFDDKLLSFFMRFGNVAFTFGMVMAAHHIVDVIALYFQELARKSDNKFDDILVPLLRKAGKTFVIAIGVVAIGNSLTLDMKSILAGLGIGGIAFALAAKDTISNLFGSLTVLLDRPFRIGDWVTIDGKIEGTIEEVGLRSTRVRTSYDSLISVPNGTLTNSFIDNYGQRTYRRFSTQLGIEYGTPPELIEAFCEGIREIILNHKWTRKDMYHVYLNGLGAASLDIMLYCFWKVPGRAEELAERHRLLIDIIRLGEELGISFAFPTQTLHVINSEGMTYPEVPSKDLAHQMARDKAQGIISDPITYQNPRSGNNDNNDQLSL